MASKLALKDEKLRAELTWKVFWLRIIRDKYLYLLILPGLLFFVVFSYSPMYGIILAFKEYKFNSGIWGSEWVGLAHFQNLFKDSDFWVAFKNTLIISFGKLLTGFPAPVILAILLNELRFNKFKRFIQSVLYMPHFLSWVIIAGILFNMFSITSGALPKILEELFGLQAPAILGNPKYFRTLVYLSNVWKTAGWGTIIYLAAIAGIDQSMYEAATIDGANRFQQIMKITIPALSYTIVILLILNVGSVMNAGFDQIFNLYDAGQYHVADILDTYVYRVGLNSNSTSQMSYATAIGLFKSVLNCVFLVSINQLAKKLGNEGLF